MLNDFRMAFAATAGSHVSIVATNCGARLEGDIRQVATATQPFTASFALNSGALIYHIGGCEIASDRPRAELRCHFPLMRYA